MGVIGYDCGFYTASILTMTVGTVFPQVDRRSDRRIRRRNASTVSSWPQLFSPHSPDANVTPDLAPGCSAIRFPPGRGNSGE